MCRFYKYHALGNDYVVLNPAEMALPLTPARVQRICHRHFGLGSDGILYGPFRDDDGALRLRIFNPDGSEAEKSGNGLRIFARYLWEQHLVGELSFRLRTAGGEVAVRVERPDGSDISVEMGRLTFRSEVIPVAGPPREVLQERIVLAGETHLFSAVSIGNPHAVFVVDRVDADLARRLGPLVERHPFFPQRTNVQFVQVVDRRHIHIEIWERGAGYTLASGSSSCAAAGVAFRLGLCAEDVVVQMPGGELSVSVRPDFSVRQRGPVESVARGECTASFQKSLAVLG